MRRCPACGAKNRDRFEDCIRCGEILVPDDSGPSRAVLFYALVGLVLLGAAAAAFRFLAVGTESSDASPPVIEASAPGEELDSAVADGPLTAREIEEAYRQALTDYQTGDYETALGVFEALARTSPSYAPAHLYAGLCLAELGNIKEASVSLRQAVKLNPENELAVRRLVPLLAELGSLGEAEALQSRFVGGHPMDAEALIELGRIHRLLGNLDAAIEEQRQAVELSASSPESLIALGDTLNEARQPKEAAELFERVIELDPHRPAAHAGLGAALVMEKRYGEAIAPLEEAVRLDPAQATVRLNLATAYERLDRIEESLREYEAFVDLTPDTTMANRIAGLVERARSARAQRP